MIDDFGPGKHMHCDKVDPYMHDTCINQKLKVWLIVYISMSFPNVVSYSVDYI